MNRPSEPFNAEERDLAQRLVRLGGPREPAPALDALILAAARAAVSEPAAAAAPADAKVTALRPRKPTTPRWPLGMGLAASLVLAAGIGWRLQGDGDGSSAELAVASAPVAANEESTEAVILEAPMVRKPPPPPPPLTDASSAAARRADVAQQALSKAVPAAPSEADFVADAPMAEAEAMAPAAAPSPSSIAAQADVDVSESKALDAVSVSGSRVAPERAVGAAEYTRTPLNERRELQRRDQTTDKATSAGGASPQRQVSMPAPAAPAVRARSAVGSTESDAEGRNASRIQSGFDDSPPVSADSTEFRQAWLQRIRNHLAKGEQNAARNSLQEFRRRYPDIELPADLQTLAATLPTP